MQFPLQLGQVCRADVGQGDILESVPDAGVQWVEIGCVAGQGLQFRAVVRLGLQEGFDDIAAVDGAARGEVVQDQRSLVQNQQQAALLTPGGQMTAQLNQLQNQWALTSQNIGRDITQNIESAVNGVSNALSGLILGTKNWRQSSAEVGQGIVQQLVKIGVQMLANFILGKVLKKADTADTIANNSAKEGSLATTGLLESITSYGVAALVGVAAFVAAMALAGSFAEGGLIPGKPSHKDNTFAHVASGEYIVRTAAVDHYGVQLFHALNSMKLPAHAAGGLVQDRPFIDDATFYSRLGGMKIASNHQSFAAGGLVGSSPSSAVPLMISAASPSVSVGGHKVTLIQTRDRSEMLQALQSSEGRKIVIGHVAGNRTKIGIPT